MLKLTISPMRRLLLIIPVLAAAMAGAGPAFPRDDDADKWKDQCLLIARECGTSVQSIQDKVQRLQDEIAKGTAVYTPEELNLLKQRLEEVNKVLDMLGNKPPYVDDRRR